MARKPRIYTQTEIYHVIMRGNNRQNLFYDDEDRNFFFQRMKKYSCLLNIEVYGYCFMNNHVHMMIGKANKYLSLFIQKLANSFVYYFNRKYECCGHLFQGRFKSEPIDDDLYFKTALRYILHNPTKSIKTDYKKFKWSSYSYTHGYKRDDWVITDYVRSKFDSYEKMIEFFDKDTNEKCMEYENKLVISDSTAVNLIKKYFNISNPRLLAIDSPNNLNKIFSLLKEYGMTLNQFSRITGVKQHLLKSL